MVFISEFYLNAFSIYISKSSFVTGEEVRRSEI